MDKILLIVMKFVIVAVICWFVYVNYLMMRFIKKEKSAVKAVEMCKQYKVDSNDALYDVCKYAETVIQEALYYYNKLRKITFEFKSLEDEKKYIDILVKELKHLQE